MAKINLLFFAIFALIAIVAFGQIENEVIGESGEDEGAASLLLEAVGESDMDGIIQALDDGEDIDTTNVNGWTAASFAVATGNLEILQFLIDKGIDLNIPNEEGYTPLMLAALQSDKELVEMLLEGNADPLIATDSGVTAYTIARDSRRLVVAATILEACVIRGMINDDIDTVMKGVKEGAYVNIRTTGGWNPLIFASAGGHAEAATELLSLGADINHVENEDWSPLHFAALNGFSDVVATLLASDADITAVTGDGRTARAMAEEGGFKEIVELLDAHAAAAEL